MAYTDSSYGLFQGQLFIAERSLNGAFLTGYEFVGDVDKFQIKPKQKFDDIQESQSGLGLTSAHIVTETAVDAEFTVLDIKFSNWARAMWGGSSPAVASGSVTGEAITLYNGQMTPLAHPGVSSVVITSTPTLTVSTDYVVDAVNGTLTVPSTSSNVAAGTPVTGTVAYTKAAYLGKVQAFITAQRYYALRLHGRNMAQGGEPVTVTVNQVTFDMAKTLDFISKKHLSFDMSGMCLQDTTVALPSAVTDLSQFFAVRKS